MKILSAEQQKEADAYTIANEPISSVNLMERAATACTRWITTKFDNSFHFNIICGLGNNGGDGLAIARLLAEKNYKVDVFILRYSDKYSEDFLENEKRLQQTTVNIKNIFSANEFEIQNHNSKSILIDAIFGTGLNKPVEGWLYDIIEKINQLSNYTIAIDIPSGLFCEKNPNSDKNAIIRAKHTLTIHSPKLSFMFSSNYKYVGDFSIMDISIQPQLISTLKSPYYFTQLSDIKNIYHPRLKFAHKGNNGHALLVCGSFGKMGAAVLSSLACLRTGTGLLTTHVPKCGYEIIQTAVPEAMVSVDSNEKYITDNIHLEKYNAVGIGPGLDTEKQTQNILKLLIQNSSLPMVLDADAINILGQNKTWLSFLPNESILTPHPKEFERLTGMALGPEDRLAEQIIFSQKYGVYIVLKGAHTSISCPNGDVHFNSTGNPGMATAGSGDVLTGIITSLLAQGYLPKEAAIMGVYLHGLAGDTASKIKQEETMIASDIITSLDEAYKIIKTKF